MNGRIFRTLARFAASSISAMCVAASAHAQSAAERYPEKPIKIIVPFAPGGSVDVLARAVGAQMQERWGQPVVIESRPGASTMIGTTAAARAPRGWLHTDHRGEQPYDESRDAQQHAL